MTNPTYQITEWDRSTLELVDRPLPVLTPGRVRVAIQAISVNPRDLVVMRGGYGRRGGNLPLTPLSDAAGRVLDVGEGVTSTNVGDAVVASFAAGWWSGQFDGSQWAGFRGGPGPGVAARVVDFDSRDLVPIPSTWTFREAAALPCAGVTAFNALEQAALRPGSHVVIQGTGGVSLFALQLAVAKGLTTTVLTSSTAKEELATSLGATHVLRYDRGGDWTKQVRSLTGGAGADAVVDVAGDLATALRALAPGGSILSIGVLAGGSGTIDVGRLVTQNMRIQGVTAGGTDLLSTLIDRMDEADLRPVLDGSDLSFDRLPQALDRLDGREHVGKICLDTGEGA